jgi:lysophospholipase L1-like esterase
VLALLTACGGDDSGGDEATPTTARTAPGSAPPQTTADASTPTVAATPPPVTGEQPLYLSVGDSLAAGIGATNPLTEGWVALVHRALPGWDLVNLGIPGDDSFELLNEGQLNDGLAEIEERAADADAGNEVGAITVDIGGNDLLDIYFDLVIPGDCPSVEESLQRPVCVEALEAALAEFRGNLAQILARLQAAAPDAPIFLMTLYNPFSGDSSPLDQIGQLSLEGEEGTPFPEGLNDVIRQVGTEAGVTVAEWYEPFLGKRYEYISMDIIHPNDEGHQVMAGVVIAAMAQAGLPVVD